MKYIVATPTGFLAKDRTITLNVKEAAHLTRSEVEKCVEGSRNHVLIPVKSNGHSLSSLG